MSASALFVSEKPLSGTFLARHSVEAPPERKSFHSSPFSDSRWDFQSICWLSLLVFYLLLDLFDPLAWKALSCCCSTRSREFWLHRPPTTGIVCLDEISLLEAWTEGGPRRCHHLRLIQIYRETMSWFCFFRVYISLKPQFSRLPNFWKKDNYHFRVEWRTLCFIL